MDTQPVEQSTETSTKPLLDFEGYPDESYQLDVYSAAMDLMTNEIYSTPISILDIGCASGKFPILLQQVSPHFADISYKGIDRNPNAVNYATHYIWEKYKEGNVKFEHADVFELKDQKFDYCFLNSFFNIKEQDDMQVYMDAVLDHVYQHLCRKGMAFNFYWPLNDEDGGDLLATEYELGSLVEKLVRKFKKVVVKSDYASGESFIFIYK